MLTRSKAELGQPRQGNGVLAELEEVGRYVLNIFFSQWESINTRV